MIYRMHVPALPLSTFVDYLWFYSGLESPNAREKLLPDAGMELLIDLDGTPKALYDDSGCPELFRNCWISGMQQRPLVIGNVPGASMMGAHFRAGGAFPFFGFPMTELATEVVELDCIWRQEALLLRERLVDEPSIKGKFALLEAFLIARARRALERDRAVDFALDRLRDEPAVTVRTLSAEIGLTQKSLLSRFHTRVGFPPKRMARVYRFQNVLRALSERSADGDCVEIALACGYYDQAHFNHEFREFSGLTPSEYVRTATPHLNWVAAD